MPASRFARLFNLCGWIAAASLILILLLIVTQVLGRLFGFSTPGITAYAGYCMAAASFFGLSYAMHENAHIRVSLFLNLSRRVRYALEVWSHLIGTGLAAYFTFYAIKSTYWSFKFHDVSQGQDATPLWIPQLVTGIGTACLTLVLAERLYWLFSKQYPLDSTLSGEV